MKRAELALLAVSGPAVFVGLVALLHVLASETNDTEAISEYALGDYGYLMNVAFVAAGVGFGALALGLRGAVVPSTSLRVAIGLLAVAALGWMLLGAGNVDREGAGTTWHGVVHGLGFLFAFPASLAAPLVLARAFRHDERWRSLRRWLLAVGLAALVAFALAFADAASPVTFRVMVGLVLAAVVLVALRLRAVAGQIEQPPDEGSRLAPTRAR